jgi:hypothetical protein
MFLRVCCTRSLVGSKLIIRNKNAIYFSKSALLRCSSTATTSVTHQLAPLSSIPPDDLGVSVLHLKENGSGTTPTDLLKRGVVFAKVYFLKTFLINCCCFRCVPLVVQV